MQGHRGREAALPFGCRRAGAPEPAVPCPKSAIADIIADKRNRPVVTQDAASARQIRLSVRYGMSDLLRFDAGNIDHLGPFLSFVGDQRSELSRRSRQRHAAEVSETGLHLRVVESRVDLLVELVDYLGRRRFRCADAPPDARFV